MKLLILALFATSLSAQCRITWIGPNDHQLHKGVWTSCERARAVLKTGFTRAGKPITYRLERKHWWGISSKVYGKEK